MEALLKECRKGGHATSTSIKPTSGNIEFESSCRKNNSSKGGWNTYLDTNTHKGLEILCDHFDLSKKLIVRQLVSEKLRELKLDNPIKEVAIRS